MARAILSSSRLFSLLGRTLSPEELGETLFRTKVELGKFGDGTVEVEVNPDRLDLLDEGGLAWEVQGALGTARGLPYGPGLEPLPGVEVRVNPSVAPLRPDIVMAVAVAPSGAKGLEAGDLEELIRFQELLHATTGRKRVSASLGLYPLERLHPPFHYVLEPAEAVRFVPLGSSAPTGAAEFYATHPMAKEFGELGRRDDLVLTLRDDARAVLSLPPVLNAAGEGELRSGDRQVLIEATGTRAARVREMVGYMLVPFLARGWSVHRVPVHGPTGTDDGKAVVEPRAVPTTLSAISSVLGVRLTAPEVEKALLSSRLGVRREAGSIVALVPPWRPDILSGVDLSEEVAIARGFTTFLPVLPPSPTVGRRLPVRVFREKVGRAMLGLGFQEMRTQVLISASSIERFAPPGEALALRNPISSELSRVRPFLRASLLDAFSRNTGSGYPQLIFEIGDVVVRDGASDTGTRTEVHLGVAEAGEGGGFARVAGIAEHLFGLLGLRPSREPAESMGSIPGRVAKLRIAGETVALLGEVHPSALTELKVPVPVGWLEVDLTRVEQLRGPSPD
jgi:phenylalanyl-tRNA synthetase beta chain